MLLKLPYGKDFLQTEIQERFEVVVSSAINPLGNLKEVVEKVLRKPIKSKPLRQFLGRDRNVWIIVPDELRGYTTNGIIASILEELETFGFQELNILIGNGLHRGMTKQEMVVMLDDDIFGKYNIINQSV